MDNIFHLSNGDFEFQFTMAVLPFVIVLFLGPESISIDVLHSNKNSVPVIGVKILLGVKVEVYTTEPTTILKFVI